MAVECQFDFNNNRMLLFLFSCFYTISYNFVGTFISNIMKKKKKQQNHLNN